MIGLLVTLGVLGAGLGDGPAKERALWSLAPLGDPSPPPLEDDSWARTSIDRFVLARLEEAGLAPAPPASPRDLVRRVHFDLTGLPPTPLEVEEFVLDPSADAYERLIDRLLASPHHGERWGQHWLDVIRFAETEGFEYDSTVPGAWRFRDYVIRSFNEDKPFDKLVAEQLAGDEIDPASPEMQIAAGFHRLGAVRRNAGNQEVASSRNEVLTERTDIIGAAFLGLTVGCARCHDHKFDPISQKDYYRLQAYLAATQEHDIVLAGAEDKTAFKARTEEVNREVAALKAKQAGASGEARERLQRQIAEAEGRLPPPLPAIPSIQNAVEGLEAVHVLLRGDWDRKGEKVGMRFLSLLLPHDAPELPPSAGRPRTLLACSILDPGNPLTARVLANRIWQYHFGQGLVKTPNDLGRNGDRPSHPLLLDHLAARLVKGGWRLKPIHRWILKSSAYRQSSRPLSASRGKEIDPENRLLWRFNRRRLDAEEIRDAMLAVSGRLNRKAGGESVVLPVEAELVDQLYKPSQWMVTADREEHDRRSIYLFAKRNLKLPFLEVFDQPSAQTSCARRNSSTHAPQALELLNGRIAGDLAAALAARLEREAGPSRTGQVDLAYRLAAGRPPSAGELELALASLEELPLSEFALAMFNLNAFLYVD